MFRLAHFLAASALSCVASFSSAADHPVVVELYTSQGCSSCPPADAFFAKELAGRDDVIALALHVDYWDYIGWKDDFADPAYSERQRNYARAAKKRSVYTPQMVVGGLDHVVGTHPAEVRSLLERHAAKDSGVGLEITRNGEQLVVKLSAEQDQDGPMVVHLVRYANMASRDIKRGENAGRTIAYSNIVTHWETIGDWNAKRAKTMRAKLKGDGAIVVLVQRTGHGAITAAARLR